MNIKVSIIMPVYNSGKYLKTAVESILNQSLREIELILVDDGSTDGSAECCDEWAQKDNRVKVIHQKNGGICAARNVGLKIASGEYIGFSDHDDEFSNNQLIDNWERINQSGLDIIKFGRFSIELNGNKILRKAQRQFVDAKYTTEQIKNKFWFMWREGLFNCVWDGLFKRTFLINNSILFSTSYIAGGEDYDFMWNCVGHGASIETNSKIYYIHNIRMNFSTSAKYNENINEMIIQRPKMLLERIKPLHIKIENDKSEYAFFITKIAIGSLCHQLAKKKCKLTIENKIILLKKIREQTYFEPWLCSISPKDITKLGSKAYAFLLLLYKNDFYVVCLFLYKVKLFILEIGQYLKKN